MELVRRICAPWIWVASALLMPAARGAEASAVTGTQLRQLERQNESLQHQLSKQQELIEELNRKVSRLEGDREREGADAEARTERAAASSSGSSTGLSLGKLRFSGEGGVGFFHSESQGQFPNSEFRVDEAKLFVEAPVWGDVYFFGELNIFTREESSANVRAGELYLDFEDVSRLWNRNRQLSVRLGRMDIPFGEEYLTRDAIDNPLISHSLMDLWGVDEGIEIYGTVSGVQYVVALQNGGHNRVRDFDADKAVVARIGLDPAKWLHISASAMRTGALSVDDDQTSELWLGNGFVRPLGGNGTTVFEANLLEGDLQLRFPRTSVKAAGGVLQYDDDDPAAQNRREVYYYYVEAVQNFSKSFYGAGRWSQVFAADGFPIPGNGDVDRYYDSVLTTDLWQLSLALGYRWGNHLVLKTEYTFARGKELGGAPRNREDMVSAVVAFGF